MNPGIFILHLIIASLWCLGLYKAFQPEMIFTDIGEWANDHFPNWLYRPTIGCIICMASISGGTYFFLITDFDWWFVLPFVVCLSGLNFFLSQFFNE